MGPTRKWCVKVPGALRICKKACVYQGLRADDLRRSTEGLGRLIDEAQRPSFFI